MLKLRTKIQTTTKLIKHILLFEKCLMIHLIIIMNLSLLYLIIFVSVKIQLFHEIMLSSIQIISQGLTRNRNCWINNISSSRRMIALSWNIYRQYNSRINWKHNSTLKNTRDEWKGMELVTQYKIGSKLISDDDVDLYNKQNTRCSKLKIAKW